MGKGYVCIQPTSRRIKLIQVSIPEDGVEKVGNPAIDVLIHVEMVQEPAMDGGMIRCKRPSEMEKETEGNGGKRKCWSCSQISFES